MDSPPKTTLQRLRQPWLVAAWPGMGGVGQIAATHLAAVLHAPLLEEFDTARFHPPTAIHIERGLVRPWRTSRSPLHAWSNPRAGADLLILLSDQQPAVEPRDYARAVLERARALGVARVVTFAAMATPIHPTAAPRVFAAASAPDVLRRAVEASAERLDDGEISGMNGLMLGAAAEQGLPALGLLGEMPFFAAGLPNPKAAAAVLRVFARISGLDLDLHELDEQAHRLERALVQHLERTKPPAQLPSGSVGQEEPGGSTDVLQHIESLFEVAGSDRAKALELKALLDRHGLFPEYEDRFLDLFRHGS